MIVKAVSTVHAIQSQVGIAKTMTERKINPYRNLFISTIWDGTHEHRSIHTNGLISMRNVLELSAYVQKVIAFHIPLSSC